MICDKLSECIDSTLKQNPISECCNKNRSGCIQSSDRRLFVKCEECGKKYTLENTKRNQAALLKMDGGVVVLDKSVPAGTNKCDYLYAIGEDKECAILTELKGVDVRKAIKQIHGTLELYKRVFSGFQHTYGRIVVTSSVPNLKASPEYVKLATLLGKNFRGNVKIFEKQCVEKDVDLDKKQY